MTGEVLFESFALSRIMLALRCKEDEMALSRGYGKALVARAKREARRCKKTTKNKTKHTPKMA
jgi:hypothetical protein